MQVRRFVAAKKCNYSLVYTHHRYIYDTHRTCTFDTSDTSDVYLDTLDVYFRTIYNKNLIPRAVLRNWDQRCSVFSVFLVAYFSYIIAIYKIVELFFDWVTRWPEISILWELSVNMNWITNMHLSLETPTLPTPRKHYGKSDVFKIRSKNSQKYANISNRGKTF
jgi:hypothetical protein